jgi:hypothetical protein
MVQDKGQNRLKKTIACSWLWTSLSTLEHRSGTAGSVFENIGTLNSSPSIPYACQCVTAYHKRAKGLQNFLWHGKTRIVRSFSGGHNSKNDLISICYKLAQALLISLKEWMSLPGEGR